MINHTPVHFEVPVDDMKRAEKFYEELFGWKIFPAGDEFDDYMLIQTVPTDDEGMLQAQGVNGGLMKRSNIGQGIINYYSVGDIDKYLIKLEKLGGTILMPKMPVTGIGWNAVVKDTEGNVFGMMQEDTNAA